MALTYIKSNKIFMPKGDSLSANLNILNDDGETYIPDETDKIIFAIKKTTADTETLYTKELQYDENGITLYIPPSATANLSFGEYKYDISVMRKRIPTVEDPDEYDVFTVIYSTIKLTEEVYDNITVQGGE